MPIHVPDLHAMRKARGLTQADLADLVGVSQPRICNLEKRNGVAGLDLLAKVIATLEALPVRSDVPQNHSENAGSSPEITDPVSHDVAAAVKTIQAETAKPTSPAAVVDPDGLRDTLASLKALRSSMTTAGLEPAGDRDDTE